MPHRRHRRRRPPGPPRRPTPASSPCRSVPIRSTRRRSRARTSRSTRSWRRRASASIPTACPACSCRWPAASPRCMAKVGDRVEQGQAVVTVESPDADVAVGAAQAEAAERQAAAALTKAEADDGAGARTCSSTARRPRRICSRRRTTGADAGGAWRPRAAGARAGAVVGSSCSGLQPLAFRPARHGPRADRRARCSTSRVAPGEYRTDTAAPLMTIADLSRVWVSAEVAEPAIGSIRVGDTVAITLVAFPGESLAGRVTRIADVVDPQTRTVKVHVRAAQSRRSTPPRHVRNDAARGVRPGGAGGPAGGGRPASTAGPSSSSSARPGASSGARWCWARGKATRVAVLQRRRRRRARRRGRRNLTEGPVVLLARLLDLALGASPGHRRRRPRGRRHRRVGLREAQARGLSRHLRPGGRRRHPVPGFRRRGGGAAGHRARSSAR